MAKVTISNKTLKDRAYEIAGKGYKKGLASMVYRFFDITTGSKSECKWRDSWGTTQTND